MAIRAATQSDVNNSIYSTWIALGLLPPMQVGDLIIDSFTSGRDIFYDKFMTDSRTSTAAFGTAGNNSGNTDFSLNAAIPAGTLPFGVIRVDSSTTYDYYRYSSWDGSTFVLDPSFHPSGLSINYDDGDSVFIQDLRIGFTCWIDVVALDITDGSPEWDSFWLSQKEGTLAQTAQYMSTYEEPITIRPLRGRMVCGAGFGVQGLEHVFFDGESEHFPGLRNPFRDSNFLMGSFGIASNNYGRRTVNNFIVEHGVDVISENQLTSEPSFRARGIEAYGGFSIFRVWQGGSAEDEVLAQELAITNCYIHDGDSEGLYIGHTGSTNIENPRCKRVFVENNVFARRGTESIQIQSFLDNAEEKRIANNVIVGGAADWIGPFQDNQSGTMQLVIGDGNILVTNNIYDSYIDTVLIMFGTNNGAAVGDFNFRRNLMLNGWLATYVQHGTMDDLSPEITFNYDQQWHIKPHTKKTRLRDASTATFDNLYGSGGSRPPVHRFKHIETESGFPAQILEDTTAHSVGPTNTVEAVRQSPAYQNSGLGYNQDDSSSGGYDYLGIWDMRVWPIITVADTSDNGSGGLRCTTSSSHHLTDGDTVITTGSAIYPNATHDGSVVRIDNDTFDILNLPYQGQEQFTMYVGHPSNFNVDEVVSHLDEDAGTVSNPAIKFYKCVSTHTTDVSTSTPDARSDLWELLYWDENGVRSDDVNYTGTPDPCTGGYFPPDNVLLEANDQWNKKGLGLLTNPTPTDTTHYKWYYADDASGLVNRTQIIGPKNATFNLNDVTLRWDWLLAQQSKYIISSVTPVDDDGRIGSERFSDGILINDIVNNDQKLWDQIAYVGDWVVAPFTTSTGQGGAYQDTGLTNPTIAQPLGSEDSSSMVNGIKGFGRNVPSVQNLINVETDVADSSVWYGSEGNYPHLIDNGGFDKYLRIRNGVSYRLQTDPGSISPAVDKPFHEIICLRVYPNPANEATGAWKHQGGTQMRYVDTNPDVDSSSNIEFFRNELWELLIDDSSNWSITKNGVLDASGTNTDLTDFTEWDIGSNGHPMEHHFRYAIMKFGEFTAEELETIRTNTNVLWPFGELPSYPVLDTINDLASTQWDSTNEKWDLYRNKTVTFSGGSGTEGVHEFQWYYWDDADPATFPIQNKLDEHIAIPGATDSSLNREHYTASNTLGNPVIFHNPGRVNNANVMCVVTPKDSSGNAGEKIVTDWTQDNITPVNAAVTIPAPPTFSDTIVMYDASVGSTIESGELNGKTDLLVDASFNERFRPNGIVGTASTPYRVKSESDTVRSEIGGTVLTTGQQVVGSLNNSSYWEFYHLSIKGDPSTTETGISGFSFAASPNGTVVSGQDIVIRDCEFANVLFNSSVDANSYASIDLRYIYADGHDTEGEIIYVGSTNKTSNISDVSTFILHHCAGRAAGREGLQVTNCNLIDVNQCTFNNVGVADIAGQNRLVQIQNSYGTIKNCLFDGAPQLADIFAHGVTFENCVFIWDTDSAGFIGKLEDNFGPSYVRNNNQDLKFVNCEFRPTVSQSQAIFNVQEPSCNIVFENCKRTSNVANGLYVDNRGTSAYSITETGTTLVSDISAAVYEGTDINDPSTFLVLDSGFASSRYYRTLGVGHRTRPVT